ncbi:MAG: sialate O-acetylesterase [Oscillospiraceae bacterium]|jgi:sialate O-acetylesterase|nr:sialate O-acetylesterase [Oscillospiraceae bacterium]
MSLKLSPLISNSMILQRNTEIKIRGYCNPNEAVEISFNGVAVTATADGNGFWLCSLGEFEACSEPLEMKISSNGEVIIVGDILIGDVWLCSGQSNMELWLSRVRHNYPDDAAAQNPMIRQFKVPQVHNFNAPSDEFSLSESKWEAFSPEVIANFTAVGYFFAKKLHERYKIPIGLLASAVGGTPVTAWMSREMLEDLGLTNELAEAEKCKDPEYIKKTLGDYEKYSQDYHKQLGESDLGFRESWAGADYDDSDWEEINIHKPVHKSGSYWYRKTIDLPEELWGKPASIFLGTAIDMDEVFVNGEKIGTTYYRYPPRDYQFTLPEGRCVIAIRLLCFGGYGEFAAGKNYFLATERRTLDIGGVWKRRQGAETENQAPMTFFNYKPTGLFNGMISPLMNTAVKGVIWYQGESDTGNPGRYAEKLSAMINGWREARGIRELPFIMTQLVYYEYTGSHDSEHGAHWEKLREQQKLCLELPKTGLALGYDLGEYNDLHPQNKRDIGERLARLAYRLAYNEKLPPNLFEMYNC